MPVGWPSVTQVGPGQAGEAVVHLCRSEPFRQRPHDVPHDSPDAPAVQPDASNCSLSAMTRSPPGAVTQHVALRFLLKVALQVADELGGRRLDRAHGMMIPRCRRAKPLAKCARRLTAGRLRCPWSREKSATAGSITAAWWRPRRSRPSASAFSRSGGRTSFTGRETVLPDDRGDAPQEQKNLFERRVIEYQNSDALPGTERRRTSDGTEIG
jgi:hypothetical protein